MRLNISGISRDDYYKTEDVMFKKLPGLKQLLSSRSFEVEISRIVSKPINYTSRRFFVDAKHDFFSRLDKLRYRQSREPAQLEVWVGTSSRDIVTKDLFDDHRLRSSEDVF